MKLGKWIGGGLGWAFLGPIGAILGFAVGSIFDMDIQVKKYHGVTQRGDFMASLIVLIAAVMKADGKILRSELDYVRVFMIKNFGEEATSEALILLRDILKKDIPVREVSEQIAANMNYEIRLQLLHFLYGLADADKHIAQSEIDTINIIAASMRISPEDIKSVRAMFIKETHSAYKILEIPPDATNEEVKKAYRQMAKKHHPDMVSNLGEEIQKAAQEKFRKINEAYETIKKERGFV
ncbi:MAG: molecular chaperone DjlA [Bacteroidetes bacterium HGW-Bacteroidetes-21]|jgi:DnaJ like chaperone protein|nr:MAG: molecular chaperone DjlA [Bacteroidetes bacterium HGW-Bacteroidetes-21]